MGQKKWILCEFLSKNPVCCFCGGETPAATRDHLPPRGIFTSHIAPEGYVFPACVSCNNGSSNDDSVISLISRFRHADPKSRLESDKSEWLKQLRAFNERNPGEARKWLLTANEKKKVFKEFELKKPDSVAYGEIPLLQFSPFVRQAIDRFSRKLSLALHYRHSGRIVPRNAWVGTWYWTNFQKAVDGIPQEIFDLVPGKVELRRGNISLGEQFDYKFGISDDGSLGAYLAAFRKSFVVAGLLCFDPSLMNELRPEDVDISSISNDPSRATSDPTYL